MNTINRIELAIRRAASQMPNHQSRAFRLLADELAKLPELIPNVNVEPDTLRDYRVEQSNLD